jgi:threonine dehydrogenase-like Zn-dependent dehydrogenase
MKQKFQQELGEVAPKQQPSGDNWHPGDAPSQALMWATEALAKGGTLSIIGVYPQTVSLFPIGQAMNKNFKINMGNCNHRRYVPKLVEIVRSGQINPAMILTESQPFNDILEAYKHFDKREPGWVKVDLNLARGQRRRAA